MTNSSFKSKSEEKCEGTGQSCLFPRSHPWERNWQRDADHSRAGTRHPLCLLFKPHCVPGDKVALPGWKLCPANCPLTLWWNWWAGGALEQSEGLDLLQKQGLLLGVYCSLSHGPCAQTALAPPCPALALREPGSEASGPPWEADIAVPPTHMMGLGSGHLPLQHPFLCFLSNLNASLPCVGAV